jgi:hypothetical protein
MESGYGTSVFIITIVIGVGVFFLVREILTWYWKINEMVGQLARIGQLLEQTNLEINQVNHTVETRLMGHREDASEALEEVLA